MYFQTPVYVAGCGTYLPAKRVSPEEAMASGLVPEREAREADYASVAVEDELFPPAMASRAARLAMDRASVRPDDVAVVVYTANHRHGHRIFWSPASFVQRELGVKRAFAFNVYAACTAQIAMSDVVLSYLLADPSRSAAVVVASDRYSGSPVSRWTSDYGIFMGDGAAAVVYSRLGGVARVLSVNTRTLAELEEVHRMDTPHEQSAATLASEYDVRETKKRYMASHGPSRLAQATREVTSELWQRSLAEAGIASRDVKKIVLPNLGRKLMEAAYFELCENQLDRTLWSTLGRSIGHLGPADQILGLDHLLETGAVRAGDHVALLGAGAGFSWSCMILEVLSPADRIQPNLPAQRVG